MVDGNSDHVRLNYDWVWDLDWDMDWERHFHFLDDWNFNLLVDWVLFDVVMVHGVDVVWNVDLDVLAESKKKDFKLNVKRIKNHCASMVLLMSKL